MVHNQTLLPNQIIKKKSKIDDLKWRGTCTFDGICYTLIFEKVLDVASSICLNIHYHRFHQSGMCSKNSTLLSERKSCRLM